MDDPLRDEMTRLRIERYVDGQIARYQARPFGCVDGL